MPKVILMWCKVCLSLIGCRVETEEVRDAQECYKCENLACCRLENCKLMFGTEIIVCIDCQISLHYHNLEHQVIPKEVENVG